MRSNTISKNSCSMSGRSLANVTCAGSGFATVCLAYDLNTAEIFPVDVLVTCREMCERLKSIEEVIGAEECVE